MTKEQLKVEINKCERQINKCHSQFKDLDKKAKELDKAYEKLKSKYNEFGQKNSAKIGKISKILSSKILKKESYLKRHHFLFLEVKVLN